MTQETGATFVYRALQQAGVELIVGLPGTQTLPIDRVIASRDGMEYVMARHETAIPHVAWGYYEVSGRPAATLTVPGPGETNAMHGLNNAREDCAPIIHLTGDADPASFGKKPIHEISPRTFDTVVKENVVIESMEGFAGAVSGGIETALTPPYGPVRLGIPTTFYDREIEEPTVSIDPETWTTTDAPPYEEAIDLLARATRPIVLVGGGVARSSAGREEAARLAETLDAPVLSTYKGKGVFPEPRDRWLGAIGGSLPPGGVAALSAADVVVALGSDFDGIATKNWSLPMGDELIHVNIDPAAIDASYEAAVGILDDAGRAARTLRAGVADRGGSNGWDGPAVARAVREEYDDHLARQGLLDEGPPFHSPAVLRTVREAIPDETVVTTDVGGFRLWSIQNFTVADRSRFVTAGSWAGMGVGLPAAIGAKLARPDEPVVCLSGDGGLLMCIHELATAVEEGLDIVLIVANNSDYAIISQRFGDTHPGEYPPFGWESPSFPRIAEGFGWSSASVDEAGGLADAIEAALGRDGPTLIDVEVPAEEPSAAQAADFETALSFD